MHNRRGGVEMIQKRRGLTRKAWRKNSGSCVPHGNHDNSDTKTTLVLTDLKMAIPLWAIA